MNREEQLSEAEGLFKDSFIQDGGLQLYRSVTG